jgi:tetratricopeptide (TPR) repeat protein
VRLIFTAIVWLVIAGGATPARADKNRDEAIKLTQLGKAALDAKDYDIALAHFQSAYKLFPSPNLRFNMGRAYDGMGLAAAADAIQAYRDFLAASDDAPLNTRTFAQERIVELERRLGVPVHGADYAAAISDGVSRLRSAA